MEAVSHHAIATSSPWHSAAAAVPSRRRLLRRRHAPAFQFLQFQRLRSSALLTWPGRKPPFYGLLIVIGAVLSVLIVYKLAFLRLRPVDVFGETMMLVYYGYAVPLSLRIGRGFYEDGIWADAGSSRIRGLAG